MEDVAAIEQAEADAYRAKYGPFERALYERLQAATDDELVEVAIWVAGQTQRSPEELFAELAAQFPEAQAAMERSGKPFDVSDPEVQAKIEQAYSAMLEADRQVLTQPLVDHLQAQGYTVRTFAGLPSVTATLPKRVILALTERPDVGGIFLIEGEGELLQAQPATSIRSASEWNYWQMAAGVVLLMLALGLLLVTRR